MNCYTMKDYRGYDLTITRLNDYEYRLKFFNPIKKRWYTVIYTREQLRRRTKMPDALHRLELIEMFNNGIIDKLGSSYEYDNATVNMTLVLQKFFCGQQIIHDGKLWLAYSEADGNLLRRSIELLAKTLGINDIDKYSKRDEDDFNNIINATNHGSAYKGYEQ